MVKYYPSPLYDTIVEPFAGTAVYSLFENNWEKDIVLVDKYDVIVRIWWYLQQANEKDILQLPSLQKGDKVDNYTELLPEEKWLIGFCINRGNPRPVKTANNYNSWDKNKVDIANNLHKIRHWRIYHQDYMELPNIKATWFIDPPYQHGGYKYKHNKINYTELAQWSRERMGQVIVCENTKANWMDFKPLKQMRGVQFTRTEAMWYSTNT